jgi:hypothetical protein
MKKWILIAAMAAVCGHGSIAFADSGASELPPNWHVHDGQTTLGPQHKPVSFFPAILGQSLADYLADPARLPRRDRQVAPAGRERERPSPRWRLHDLDDNRPAADGAGRGAAPRGGSRSSGRRVGMSPTTA